MKNLDLNLLRLLRGGRSHGSLLSEFVFDGLDLFRSLGASALNAGLFGFGIVLEGRADAHKVNQFVKINLGSLGVLGEEHSMFDSVELLIVILIKGESMAATDSAALSSRVLVDWNLRMPKASSEKSS